MSIRALFNKTATRQRFEQVATSRRGQPAGGYTDEAEYTVALQPVSGREVFDGKQVVIVSARAYAEPAADIREGDRLAVAGETYRVVHVADAAGMGHHLEIDLVVHRD